GEKRMSSPTVIPVPPAVAAHARIDAERYRSMYERSIRDPDGFWAEQGRRLGWIRPFTKVKDVDYTGDVHIRWYEDGTLNACWNCVDRHLPQRADQTA